MQSTWPYRNEVSKSIGNCMSKNRSLMKLGEPTYINIAQNCHWETVQSIWSNPNEISKSNPSGFEMESPPPTDVLSGLPFKGNPVHQILLGIKRNLLAAIEANHPNETNVGTLGNSSKQISSNKILSVFCIHFSKTGVRVGRNFNENLVKQFLAGMNKPNKACLCPNNCHFTWDTLHLLSINCVNELSQGKVLRSPTDCFRQMSKP